MSEAQLCPTNPPPPLSFSFSLQIGGQAKKKNDIPFSPLLFECAMTTTTTVGRSVGRSSKVKRKEEETAGGWRQKDQGAAHITSSLCQCVCVCDIYSCLSVYYVEFYGPEGREKNKQETKELNK